MKSLSARIVLISSICFLSQRGFSQARYTITDEAATGPNSPRVVVLHDHVAGQEAAVAPSEGGELASYKVTYKGQSIEMLYHARNYDDKTGFQGKGPLLWPAVGAQYPTDTVPKASCGTGTYKVAGTSYPMPCHGFARLVPWKEVSRAADSHSARVTVELTDSEATRKYYPFAFHLDANFELMNGHLTVYYVVKSDATNTEPMPFSIGNHIGFNLPFLPGTDPAKMLFETQSTVQLLRNTVGVLNGQQKPRSFYQPEELGSFDAHVAMPLTGYKSQPFSRLIDPQGMSLRLTQTASSTLPEPLIRTNAFGGPAIGYFCPEPWFGVQNSLNTGVGLVKLQAGESWTWRLDLQIEPPPVAAPSANSELERVGTGFSFVEGPVWVKDEGGYLLFSDIYNSRTMKIATANQPEIYRRYTRAGNGNSLDVQGRLYTAERDGHRVSRQEKDGRETIVASSYEGKRLNSPNDVVVRRDGQVYFSDPASAALLEPRELSFNGLYHVDPQGKVTLIAKMPRPNGVALTEDGRTLYVADSTEKTIHAYDLDKDGNASHERTLISGIEGTPDGLRVAANGNLYVACKGIAIYTPTGKLIKMIEFPETPVNCAFGGPDLQTLYVTAQTSVYRLRVPDKGSSQY
jgi:gluconolactonase